MVADVSIAGIDFSTRFVDVVLLDEDTDAAEWHRFELVGQDAFDRSRLVRDTMPNRSSPFWDETIAVGIEDPRGYNAGALYRIQGAILSCLPRTTLVHPLIPSHWRKTVGLPGNASKDDVAAHAVYLLLGSPPASKVSDYRRHIVMDWPQDACDAYCIALATRTLLQHGEQAA
jgi:hypothetical protein